MSRETSKTHISPSNQNVQPKHNEEVVDDCLNSLGDTIPSFLSGIQLKVGQSPENEPIPHEQNVSTSEARSKVVERLPKPSI